MNASGEHTIAETLGQFVSRCTFDSIPREARERAKYLILDGVGIAYAATTFEFAPKTFNALRTLGAGGSDVIGFGKRLTLRDAVLMNGVLIHGLDYDDTHLAGVVHATAGCFPCALAMTAYLHRSGSDLLVAYILGMEVSARLGAVAKGELTQIGFHPTGVVVAFGASLISGYLYGLSAQELTMAQGIVLSMASGVREYSTDGTWTKRIHPGWAGAAGITAATLAKGGFLGPRTTYEGPYGLYATHLAASAKSECDFAAATAGLGEVWEVTQVAIKPLPAGQFNIAPIDAAIGIVTKYSIDPKEITDVNVLIPQHAVKTVCEPLEVRRRPNSSYAAQFSIPYLVACGLVCKKLGLAELERYRDPQILELADKVRYTADPNSGYPKYYSGEVIVTMKDGRRFAQREDINRGAADNPVSEADIVAKFMDNAALVLTKRKAMKIRDAILSIDSCPDAHVLSRALSNAAKVRRTRK